MKKHILIIFFILNSFIVFSQLDETTVMGIPTGTTAEINAVTPVDDGAVVYNSDTKKLMVYIDPVWVNISNNETITSFSQNTSVTSNSTTSTGELTYTDENGNESTAQVVSTDANNTISAGTDGGAYSGPTVYVGSFKITKTGLLVITGLPFQPSQITFVAHANIETENIYPDNLSDDDSGNNNDSGSNNNNSIPNSFGTMNGFARNEDSDNKAETQQVIYVGGSGNSINNISRLSSSSYCIGLRYSNQNGVEVGRTLGNFYSFDTDGFSINVMDADDDVLVMYTAYK